MPIMQRTVKLTREIFGSYLRVDEEYNITLPQKPCPYMGEGSVDFRRVGSHAGTFMQYGEFKRHLREGSIVFTN